MDKRLAWAVENNAGWCDLVCRAHGVPTKWTPGLWVASRRPPELYPDAVTLVADAGTSELLRSIQSGPGASVKDSFATLDLESAGFHELFGAQWIYRDAIGSGRPSLCWTIVDTEEQLHEWALLAGAPHAFRPRLLRNPEVRILAVRTHDGFGAGLVANLTGPVVGISNVFATTISADEAWLDVPRVAASLFPGSPLVGYEHGPRLDTAVAAGFAPVGQLRVWLRASALPG